MLPFHSKVGCSMGGCWAFGERFSDGLLSFFLSFFPSSSCLILSLPLPLSSSLYLLTFKLDPFTNALEYWSGSTWTEPSPRLPKNPLPLFPPLFPSSFVSLRPPSLSGAFSTVVDNVVYLFFGSAGPKEGMLGSRVRGEDVGEEEEERERGAGERA